MRASPCFVKPHAIFEITYDLEDACHETKVQPPTTQSAKRCEAPAVGVGRTVAKKRSNFALWPATGRLQPVQRETGAEAATLYICLCISLQEGRVVVFRLRWRRFIRRCQKFISTNNSIRLHCVLAVPVSFLRQAVHWFVLLRIRTGVLVSSCLGRRRPAESASS